MRALFARYPGLRAAIPHVDLGVIATPVERVVVRGRSLLLKRDDLSAALLGGNKVRALEFLLAGARPGQTVLTVGSTGSTHALATAVCAGSLGLACEVITWPQEENSVSRATAQRLERVARVTRARSPVDAYVRALLRRVGGAVHWIPAGGSSPVGVLGAVSAAVELAGQLESGGLTPGEIVVPLGSGGTAAGLLVGQSIAETGMRVTGVRVVPRIIGNRGHVLRLAWQAHRLIRRHAGVQVPPLRPELLTIEHGAFGGAYGRETDVGASAAVELRAAGGPALDATYSAKAFAVALARLAQTGDDKLLYWLTFDARWLGP